MDSVRDTEIEKASTAVRTDQIPALDGLRGLACLCVVLAHLNQAGFVDVSVSHAGALGVSVFFSLSGFLMAYLYARKPFTVQTIAPYVVSRFARIAPAYLLVIVLSWFVKGAVDTGFVYDINNHNIVRHLLFSGSESVFWSIPPEVQFYVFFLGLWWAIRKAASGVYSPTWIMLAVSTAMVLFSAGLPGTTLPTKLTFFLFGSLAGYLSAHTRGRFDFPRAAVVLQIGLICCVMAWLGFLGRDAEAPYRSVAYALLCMMLIFAFSLPSRHADSLFGSKAMVMLGKWSLAIYLIHEVCLYIAKKPVASGYLPNSLGLALGLGLTFGAAFVLHACVERPAQRRLKTLSRVFG